MTNSPPIESGWHLVRLGGEGQVEERGPRLAGTHPLELVLAAVRAVGTLTEDDERAMAQVAEDARASLTVRWRLQPLMNAGLVQRRSGFVEVTRLGRVVLALAASLRRAVVQSGPGGQV